MVSFHPTETHSKDLFSILIPSWNNLPFLKTCVESIRKNSRYAHQLIIHVNEGVDGTLEWVKKQGLAYTYSAENVGICMACNAAASLAYTDYILYLNDDMYVCPDWDYHLFCAIQEYGKKTFYFSGTMIERKQNDACYISAPHDYGDHVDTFREADLLRDVSKLSLSDSWGAIFPPSIMHKDLWTLIGGFSIEFSPGMYSDPDISRKLWALGVRNFRSIGKCLVYHFMSKSVQRVTPNPGREQFIDKWGISNRIFRTAYLRLGEAIDAAELTEPEPDFSMWMGKVISRLKVLWK
ncbi:MAG: glycosyltransferase [Siphonobacter sp.]